MILTAGLTPAWQHVLDFERLHIGEVNRARSAFWCPSGKVLNAAIALRHLQVQARTLTILGGDTGKFVEQELRKLQVDVEVVHSETPTRICTTLVDRTTGQATELVENAGPVSAETLQQFSDRFHLIANQCSHVLLIGSLPKGVPSDFYRQLVQDCPAKVIMDARGQELLACLPHHPFLVKPNREELSRTVGRDLKSDEDLLSAMRDLNQRGAEWVVVTQGSHAVWLTSLREAYRLIPCAVPVVNPIGCGDCMAGAMVAALEANSSAVEAVRFGMGAAAENAMHLMSARLDRNTVKALAAKVKIEPIHP